MSVCKTTNAGLSWGIRKNLGVGASYPSICWDIAVAPGDSSIVYAGGQEDGYVKVFRSADGGNSWARERIPVNYPLYEIRTPKQAKVAAAGETAFISIDLHGKAPEFPLVGVVGRDDAPPGEGAYDIAFAAPHGPYFYDIKSMAFRSTADGYVVGPLTSIVLEDGAWVKETVPEAWSPEFRLVAAGPSSYWSIVYPSELSQKPILYEDRF